MNFLKKHPKILVLTGILIILVLLAISWVIMPSYPNSYLSWGPSVEIDSLTLCREPNVFAPYLGRPEIKIYRGFTSQTPKEEILRWFKDKDWNIIPKSGFSLPEESVELPMLETSFGIEGIVSIQQRQIIFMKTLGNGNSLLGLDDTFDLCFPWQRTKIELPGY